MTSVNCSENRRAKLIEAAVKCFHQQGYANVTLAVIAAEVGMPLGNVYYYFKTKAAFAEAAVQAWRTMQAAKLVELDALPTARKRLLGLLDSAETWKKVYTEFGCPLANLARDLLSTGEPDLATQASDLYAQLYEWTEHQFRLWGGTSASAQTNSRILVAGLQGGILMAHANQNPELMTGHVAHLRNWLETLEYDR